MIDMAPVANGEQLRRAFACFPSGVAALCALVDDAPVGIAASSFTLVSLAPPLVSVCMQHTSSTWPTLRTRPRLGLSILAEGHDEASVRLSRKDIDRFAGLDWFTSPESGIFVHGATAWLDCSVHSDVPAGDRTIVLLEVHGLHADLSTPSLVFHGRAFRRRTAV